VAIRIQAQDGSVQTFPDGTSLDAVQLAMTAYDNRESWGGLAKKVGSAINQTAEQGPAPPAPLKGLWSQNAPAAYLDSLGFLSPDLRSQISTVFPLASAPAAPSIQGSPVSPQTIDDYLKSKNSPMVGQGQAFYDAGLQNNVDPRLLVGLAGAETGFGNNLSWGRNNAFNWGWNTKQRANSPFDSWESGIQSVAKGVPKNFSLDDTATLYKKYCSGPDCVNGLRNLNTFMIEQGADPANLRLQQK
jgi:hypothetical protein